MYLKNTVLNYSFAAILSTGKLSFENVGRILQTSGDTAKRLLPSKKKSLEVCQSICRWFFRKDKRIYVTVDDTLLKKFYSRYMQGTGYFYDSKMGRRINAYKLILGIISNKKFAIPSFCAYLFSKELEQYLSEPPKNKFELTKACVELAMQLFPDKEIIVVADGLYATTKFVQWCSVNNIKVELRMASNRVIEYQGKRMSLKELAFEHDVRPKGRQMARTVSAVWHGMDLEFTVERRIDKHGNESIVFQVATYKALPREHVANYKCRWPVEKVIRTGKQSLGLGDCFSTLLDVQHDHVAAVLLAYALVQVERKRQKLKTPEDAIRRLEKKNVAFLERRFSRFLDDNHIAYA